MAEITLNAVSKIYPGNVTAVKEVSLTIPDRTFCVLVGPSGCGKSTLLRMIAGLEEITTGECLIDGKRANDLAPRNRDLAMVFQNYALYPHMSVEQNLAFGLAMAGTPRPEIIRRVGETAEILGIQELLKRKPKALSGGQRQRVALGRAMIRKPRAFLFDEPLSNLDAKLRVQMRSEITRIVSQLQTTAVYVTHDQTEAMTMGEMIVCLKDGRIQQQGTPMDLYKRPANQFVAGFIGMPPMNFLAATIRDNSVHLDCCDTVLALPEHQRVHSAVQNNAACTVGLRPEYLELTAESAGTIPVEVELVELLGSLSMVYCIAGKQRLVVQTGPFPHVKKGEVIRVRPHMDEAHFFS